MLDDYLKKCHKLDSLYVKKERKKESNDEKGRKEGRKEEERN